MRSSEAAIPGGHHHNFPEVDDCILGSSGKRVARRCQDALPAVPTGGVPLPEGQVPKAQVENVHSVQDGVVDRGDHGMISCVEVHARCSKDLVDADACLGRDAAELTQVSFDARTGSDHRHGRTVPTRVSWSVVVRRRTVRILGIQHLDVRAHCDDLVGCILQVRRVALGVSRNRCQRIILEGRVFEIKPRIDDRDLHAVPT